MKALSFSESLIKNKVSDFCVEFGYQDEKELFNDYGFYDGEKEKKVLELSGGQRQILTVIRAILTSPDVLIMDEPFSAIDIYKGAKFREKVFSFIRANNITTFFIGHTLDELVLFSDRIIFCDHDSKGKIIQGIEDIPESDDDIAFCLNNWKEKYGHS
jgi:ABC-type nitrate/sulfonate/bicarbonate transport system ATPase subunit